MEQHAPHAAVGGLGQGRGDPRKIAHEVRDKYSPRLGDHGTVLGRRIIRGVVLTQRFGKSQNLGPARPRRQGAAGQADAFTAPLQQNRQRQSQQPCAVSFLVQRGGRGKAHRGPLIAPQHNRLRDLPFAFAYELRVAHGAAAVVDHAAAVAHLCRTVLPEIITRASAPAPVVAQQDGTGQILGTGQQRGQARGLILG